MRRSELQAGQPLRGISRKPSFDLSTKSDCKSKQISADATLCAWFVVNVKESDRIRESAPERKEENRDASHS